ncbi:DUF4287 domain-containing protein [Frankia sp. CNm7]|uniref:DUF4287 domain-containing protein n=1 Tax=Frankia nepalensis TaxID=1836974 RepID=A0A937UPK7_9ACTN|nr:DUF4287 domain-containing protein [Frankia nepalensis]MBL7498582.1 DUF4287 domain-containing protein [Frankia nepalensis]MBL7515039.1 DUF4287 domain-containing protein [Frankia nepalensis]MBL7519415.1 DUF4287 domain-containing protein [Frankia nepalensis]MBL7629173.1 DUF4287 domain-containing protein [Frankia nepalensis]
MSQYRSVQTQQTHQILIERLPKVTGHDLSHWLARIEDGPGLLRFPERVNWLRDEYNIPHRYAAALVHESDLRRRAIRV